MRAAIRLQTMPLALILIEVMVAMGAGIWGWVSLGAARAAGVVNMLFQGAKAAVLWCVSAGLLVVAAQELVKVLVQKIAN